MTQRVLIMGLPGAGKTTLAQALKGLLEASGKTVSWFNADEIRKQYNDWDFSADGRIRQSHRMRDLADACGSDYALCDFVAPLIEMRHNFKADWTIWMDTIREGRYADTNKAFIEPDIYDFRITEQDAMQWAGFVAAHLLIGQRRPKFDWKKPTVQMLGRWQPWHDGHRALFERAIAKTGQVVIQVRDCQGWQGSNPFDFFRVVNFIKQDLEPLYQGQFDIQLVPNITNITYGRAVGYTIEEESFDEDIVKISATKIRKSLGLD